MNEFELGQIVYYFEYIQNLPYLRQFVVAAIRQTEQGYSYSQYINPASIYVAEEQLFETIEGAVANGVALLESFLPPED